MIDRSEVGSEWVPERGETASRTRATIEREQEHGESGVCLWQSQACIEIGLSGPNLLRFITEPNYAKLVEPASIGSKQGGAMLSRNLGERDSDRCRVRVQSSSLC